MGTACKGMKEKKRERVGKNKGTAVRRGKQRQDWLGDLVVSRGLLNLRNS